MTLTGWGRRARSTSRSSRCGWGTSPRPTCGTLYAQHTAETGQEFTADALARAWELTAGQPWLVNALAREVIEKIEVPVTEPITADHIDTAKERLILARATHLDSLLARLDEPRVRRVLEPMMAGDTVNPTRPSTTTSPTYATSG